MSIIDELSATPQPPAFSAVLGDYPRSNVARKLGISISYWSLLRNGRRDASPDLQRRIDKLVEAVKAEQQAVSA